MLLAIALGLVLGVGSAIGCSYAAFRSGGVHVGPWTTNVDIGSSAANPWLRSAVALGGLLALDRRETLYFTAFTDDSGEPLSRRCEYLLEGPPPRARWWSITAYGADSYLLPNLARRYSMGGGGDPEAPAIAAKVAPGSTPDVAIPLGDAPTSGGFSLTLRLYQPDETWVRAPETARLPALRRLRCR